MSWERVGGAGNARKAIADLAKFYDRVSGPLSRQGFPVSRHGSQVAGSCLVAT